MERPENLVVFDFDKSLCTEADTDEYVCTKLLPDISLVEATKALGPNWPTVMNHMTSLMRERGFQESDIAKALDGLRIQPCVTEALKYMHDKKGALIRILSDANTFWIDTVLKQSGADKYIDKVFTNPSQFDSESGKLVIRPFYEGPEHNCPYGCGPNMCKGMELDKWLKHMQPERIVYVGDGKNDFCPANRLRAGDLLLVRKGLSLDKRICDSKEPLAVPYKYWSSADELAELLHAAFE